MSQPLTCQGEVAVSALLRFRKEDPATYKVLYKEVFCLVDEIEDACYLYRYDQGMTLNSVEYRETTIFPKQ